MSEAPFAFTQIEADYLRGQLLGRLATVDTSGAPQNNPVGFALNDANSQVIIGGHGLVQSRKFRNITANRAVAFVVDDLVSTDPWTPRGVEIRGMAQTATDVEPVMEGFDRALIRISPLWIGSWGLEPAISFEFTVRRADGSKKVMR